MRKCVAFWALKPNENASVSWNHIPTNKFGPVPHEPFQAQHECRVPGTTYPVPLYVSFIATL